VKVEKRNWKVEYYFKCW